MFSALVLWGVGALGGGAGSTWTYDACHWAAAPEEHSLSDAMQSSPPFIQPEHS